MKTCGSLFIFTIHNSPLTSHHSVFAKSFPAGKFESKTRSGKLCGNLMVMLNPGDCVGATKCI